MPDPPEPITPSSLLTAVAALLWVWVKNDPSGTGIGRMKTTANAARYLYPVQSGGDVAWASGSSVPTGAIEALMTSATFDVLHGGSLNTDGSIAFGGHDYRVKLWTDSVNIVAVAVQV